MKRFTETLKWSDPWYRRLSPSAKLLYFWILDNCDHAGVIDVDIELAAFQIGMPMGMDTLSELGDRVRKLESGKWHVVKFINFQYGELSKECKAHNPVFASISKHLPKGYLKGINTLPHRVQDKDKDKDTDKDKEEEGVYGPACRASLHYLNERTGKHFRESETSLAPIGARLKETGVTAEGVKKMIDRQCAMWLGTRMQEYLRPETLFGKEKFNSYYAAKDMPVQLQDRPPEVKPTPRAI